MKHRKITEPFIPSVEQDGKIGPNLSEHIASGKSQITIDYLTSMIKDLKKQLEIQKKELTKEKEELQEEYKKALDEGFEEAYKMLKEERKHFQDEIDELQKQLKAKDGH